MVELLYLLFGSFNQSQGNNFSYDQSLMNYNRYSNSTNQTLRTYLKFTQRLGSTSEEDKEKKKSLFSDAFYNIRVDYQSTWQENQNLDHGTNFFDYGYIGKFTEYRRPFYQFQRTPTLHIDQNGDTSTRQVSNDGKIYAADSLLRPEDLIQQAIKKLMVNRTSIVVAHRLSTIKEADSILVLDKGSVVEIGDHKELIAKKGAYFTLFQKQFELIKST